MKHNALFSAALAACVSLASFVACDDEVSQIGSSLSRGEVEIFLDSLEYDIEAAPVYLSDYDARSTTDLIGRINVPEYGSLRCSFIGALMPATSINIPDSIPREFIDSLRMIVAVPRGHLTGDSLAPQQLKVYTLNRQLPADVSNSFDPSEYYDPSRPLATASYALTKLNLQDTLFRKGIAIEIPVRLPKESALQVYDRYKSDPSIFEWPATFAKVFPGIYIEPSFGRGCIANVGAVDFYLYWHHLKTETKVETDGTVIKKEVVVKDSVSVFSTAPEVVCANLIDYEPSQAIRSMAAAGRHIITTPGGYALRIKFPAEKIISDYQNKEHSMSMISGLSFAVPASPVKNDFGINAAPYLAMIKTSELDSFFSSNKVPDNVTSFWAPYNGVSGRYSFTSMRQYILDLIAKGSAITDDDCDFTLVPVNIVSESETNSYTGVTTTTVTRCMPYMLAPTMTELFAQRSIICFTYSLQTIK